MKEKILGILSEESLLGRITSRIWILFASNLLFVLFSLPVVTAGPAWVAMYYVCLKTLRVDSSLSPVREFWKGFRTSFRQAFPAFLAVLAVSAVLILDIMFVSRTQDVMRLFRWPVYLVTGFGDGSVFGYPQGADPQRTVFRGKEPAPCGSDPWAECRTDDLDLHGCGQNAAVCIFMGKLRILFHRDDLFEAAPEGL